MGDFFYVCVFSATLSTRNQQQFSLVESFVLRMLLLQRLIGLLDGVLADEKQREWMLLQKASST